MSDEKVVHEWDGDGNRLRVVITDNGLRFQFKHAGDWLDHETDGDLLVKFHSLASQLKQETKRCDYLIDQNKVLEEVAETLTKTKEDRASLLGILIHMAGVLFGMMLWRLKKPSRKRGC